MTHKNRSHSHRGKSKRKTTSKQNTEGILRTTARGTGYVIVEDQEESITIDQRSLNTGLDGDSVEICLLPTRDTKKLTGEVVRVISRAKTRFVGTITKDGPSNYFSPQDQRIYVDFIVPKQSLRKARQGDKVLIEMVAWDNPKKPPEARVVSVIGRAGEHETEIQAILLDRGAHTRFPRSVTQEARAIQSDAQTILHTELSNRLDMRHVTTLTIDPDDAKDFDDALSFRMLSDGTIEIGVHIADVTHYVTEGLELDKEAKERGTSIYLVDRTIPMLPEELSNDLCSLNPNEDKLAYSVIFQCDPSVLTGSKPLSILSFQITETVINSDERLTYRDAQDIIEGDHDSPYSEAILALHKISEKLRAENKKKGALTFEQEEVKFKLDEKGKPVDVYVKQILDSNHLVEQFMLLANRKVTEHIKETIPEAERLFFYRIHDNPPADRIVDLIELLRSLGYAPRASDGTLPSKELNRILGLVKGHPEEILVQTAAIRSMAKAIYSTENVGHYGLAFDNYTHFTSPIRRYPDMIVHRLLKMYGQGQRLKKKLWNDIAALADSLSNTERTAMETERASIKFKQVEYMADNLGKVYDGVISGVTEWGLFVQDTRTKSEGLIRVRTMNDDFYVFEKSKMRLVGQDKGKRYTLGDPIRFKVKDVNVDARTIDCILVT